jgi:PTH1 family peptidyl-tRNA hydrolase
VKVLVGLGNPGPEYRATRHNVGYLVAEAIRARSGSPRERRADRCLSSRVTMAGGDVVLARPLTYMNRSGEAVAALLDLAGAEPKDLMVICDDLYLELGSLRLRPRGSHGGHNGLRSIIEVLGTQEFPRLRLGVGPADPGVDYADFVLAPFPRADRERVEQMVGEAADCVEAVAAHGLPKAMNRYNRTQRAAGESDEA